MWFEGIDKIWKIGVLVIAGGIVGSALKILMVIRPWVG